jgi:hypothetical protein
MKPKEIMFNPDDPASIIPVLTLALIQAKQDKLLSVVELGAYRRRLDELTVTFDAVKLAKLCEELFSDLGLETKQLPPST